MQTFICVLPLLALIWVFLSTALFFCHLWLCIVAHARVFVALYHVFVLGVLYKFSSDEDTTHSYTTRSIVTETSVSIHTFTD